MKQSLWCKTIEIICLQYVYTSSNNLDFSWGRGWYHCYHYINVKNLSGFKVVCLPWVMEVVGLNPWLGQTLNICLFFLKHRINGSATWEVFLQAVTLRTCNLPLWLQWFVIVNVWFYFLFVPWQAFQCSFLSFFSS